MTDLGRAASLLSHDANDPYELAVANLALGDAPAAVTHDRKARQLAPADTRVFAMLAQIQLPGEFYFPLLERIVHLLQPRTYVEIGIFQGDSLKMARSASAVIGIDPAPQISWTLAPHMRVYKMASDDFFARHELPAELGNRPVDLAFIDGMHQFEYALRDFTNLERHCHKDSVILIHDCYPIDEVCAGREPRAVNWCGNIWRLISPISTQARMRSSTCGPTTGAFRPRRPAAGAACRPPMCQQARIRLSLHGAILPTEANLRGGP